MADPIDGIQVGPTNVVSLPRDPKEVQEGLLMAIALYDQPTTNLKINGLRRILEITEETPPFCCVECLYRFTEAVYDTSPKEMREIYQHLAPRKQDLFIDLLNYGARHYQQEKQKEALVKFLEESPIIEVDSIVPIDEIDDDLPDEDAPLEELQAHVNLFIRTLETEPIRERIEEVINSVKSLVGDSQPEVFKQRELTVARVEDVTSDSETPNKYQAIVQSETLTLFAISLGGLNLNKLSRQNLDLLLKKLTLAERVVIWTRMESFRSDNDGVAVRKIIKKSLEEQGHVVALVDYMRKTKKRVTRAV